MNIADSVSKVKAFLDRHRDEISLFFIVFLVILFVSGVWRLYAREQAKTPIRIEMSDTSNINGRGMEEVPVVASSRGTRYYFPWCDGAEKLSPKNKISFPKEADALKAGYILAANCR